jgi:hypothetical protein
MSAMRIPRREAVAIAERVILIEGSQVGDVQTPPVPSPQ